MMFVNASVIPCTAEDQRKERAYYKRRGWPMPGATTHLVNLTIEVRDLDDFCTFLKALPRDEDLKSWESPTKGRRFEAPTVTLKMRGQEGSDGVIKLRGRYDLDRLPASGGQIDA